MTFDHSREQVAATQGRITLPDDARVTALCDELGAIAARYLLAGIANVPEGQRRRTARALVLRQVQVMAMLVTQRTLRHVRHDQAVRQMLAGIEDQARGRT